MLTLRSERTCLNVKAIRAAALLAALVVLVGLLPASPVSAVNPPPGATFHGYGLFTDSASFAYTGICQQRPDQEPPLGMDPPGCSTPFAGAPVYYPQWVLLTSDAQEWLEIGSGLTARASLLV